MKTLVFMTITKGKIKNATNTIKRINNVIEAYPLTGKYDLYAKLETDNESEILELVDEKIRNIEGVVSTETCIIIENY